MICQYLISSFSSYFTLHQTKIITYSIQVQLIYLRFSIFKILFSFFLYLFKKMAESQQNQSYSPKEKKTYRRVSYQNKLKLLQMVLSQGKKIRSSAKVLRMNESTAKMIISRHKSSLNKIGADQEKIVMKQTQVEAPVGSEKQKEQEQEEKKIVWIQIVPVIGVPQYFPYFSNYQIL